LSSIEEFLNVDIDVNVLDKEFPKKFFKDRFSYKGIATVADMYTRRNLFALTLLFNNIKKNAGKFLDLLMLAFTNTVLHVSKLKGENVRPLGVNNYWVPDDYIEENVWFRFEDRFENLVKGKAILQKRIAEKQTSKLGCPSLSIKSALESMGENCVDYVFTDPPYGDAIQYSELSYVWNAWLDETYNNKEEIIVNPVQSKGHLEFNNLLCEAINNIVKALKVDRYFTLCFQNKDFSIWKNLINHCKSLNLSLVDIAVYDTFGSPFNKSWANFSPKADIYVTFQKKESNKNSRFYCKDMSLPDIINDVKQFIVSKNIAMDHIRLYDLTISYIIWNMYYNKGVVDIGKFNTKSFVNMLSESVLVIR